MEDLADLGIAGIENPVPIGSGGFATVYRASQPAFGRTVAVKILNVTNVDEDTQRRFDRERAAMGALSTHPGIVTVHDAGFTNDGRPYLIIEYMPHGSIADRLARIGTFGWEEATRMGVKLSGALETAHRFDILHRDIKPENILLSEYGEPQLSDFGIARIAGTTETRSGVVTASLAHAPPEVLSGERPSPASDVYSLASTLHQMISGAAPFSREPGEHLITLLARIVREPVPDLRPRGVPHPLCLALEQAMAKDPGQRPPSAEALGRTLQEVQERAGMPVTELRTGAAPPRLHREEPPTPAQTPQPPPEPAPVAPELPPTATLSAPADGMPEPADREATEDAVSVAAEPTHEIPPADEAPESDSPAQPDEQALPAPPPPTQDATPAPGTPTPARTIDTPVPPAAEATEDVRPAPPPPTQDAIPVADTPSPPPTIDTPAPSVPEATVDHPDRADTDVPPSESPLPVSAPATQTPDGQERKRSRRRSAKRVRTETTAASGARPLRGRRRVMMWLGLLVGVAAIAGGTWYVVANGTSSGTDLPDFVSTEQPRFEDGFRGTGIDITAWTVSGQSPSLGGNEAQLFNGAGLTSSKDLAGAGVLTRFRLEGSSFVVTFSVASGALGAEEYRELELSFVGSLGNGTIGALGREGSGGASIAPSAGNRAVRTGVTYYLYLVPTDRLGLGPDQVTAHLWPVDDPEAVVTFEFDAGEGLHDWRFSVSTEFGALHLDNFAILPL